MDAAVATVAGRLLLLRREREAIIDRLFPKVQRHLEKASLPLDGEVLLNASLLRGSGLCWRHDADFLVPLREGGFRTSDGERRKPSDIINEIAGLLHTQFHGTLNVEVLSGQKTGIQVHIDGFRGVLLPVFRSKDGEHELELPGTFEDKWVGISPSKHNERFHTLNEETDGALVTAVVLLETMKEAVFPPLLSRDGKLSFVGKLSSLALEEATCSLSALELNSEIPWRQRLETILANLGKHLLASEDMPPHSSLELDLIRSYISFSLQNVYDVPSLQGALGLLPNIPISGRAALKDLLSPQQPGTVGGVALVFLQGGTTFPESMDNWGLLVEGVREAWAGLCIAPYELSLPDCNRGLWKAAYSCGIFVLEMKYRPGVRDTLIFIDCATIDASVELEALMALSSEGTTTMILTSKASGNKDNSVVFSTNCGTDRLKDCEEFNLFVPGRPRSEHLDRMLNTSIEETAAAEGVDHAGGVTVVEQYLNSLLLRKPSSHWLRASLSFPRPESLPAFVAKFSLPCVIMGLKERSAAVTTIQLHCDLRLNLVFPRILCMSGTEVGARLCFPLLHGTTIQAVVPLGSAILAVAAGLPNATLCAPLDVMGCPVSSVRVGPVARQQAWESDVVRAFHFAPNSCGLEFDSHSDSAGGCRLLRLPSLVSCDQWSTQILLDLLSIVVDVIACLEAMMLSRVSVWSLAMALNALRVDGDLFPAGMTATTSPASGDSPSFAILRDMAGHVGAQVRHLSDLVVIPFLQWRFDCFCFQSDPKGGHPTVEVRRSVREHLPGVSRAAPLGTGLFSRFLDLIRPTPSVPPASPGALNDGPISPGVARVVNLKGLRLRLGLLDVTEEAAQMVASSKVNVARTLEMAAVLFSDDMVYLADLYEENCSHHESFNAVLYLALQLAQLPAHDLHKYVKNRDAELVKERYETIGYEDFRFVLRRGEDKRSSSALRKNDVLALCKVLRARISEESIKGLVTLLLENPEAPFTFVTIEKPRSSGSSMLNCSVVKFAPRGGNDDCWCNCEHLEFSWAPDLSEVIWPCGDRVLPVCVETSLRHWPVESLRRYLEEQRQAGSIVGIEAHWYRQPYGKLRLLGP